METIYSRDAKEMNPEKGKGAVYIHEDIEYKAVVPVPREVIFSITTWRGQDFNAVHYYGELKVYDLSFCRKDKPGTFASFGGCVGENFPDEVRGIKLKLVREVTKKELRTEKFKTYREGDLTECFNSKEELLIEAIKEFHRIFGHTTLWCLIINDSTEDL